MIKFKVWGTLNLFQGSDSLWLDRGLCCPYSLSRKTGVVSRVTDPPAPIQIRERRNDNNS